MRRISFKSVLTLVLCGFAIYFIMRYLFSFNPESSNWDFLVTSTEAPKERSKIVLAFVVCEDRLNQSLNVVKSMLLFTKASVHLIIFADDIRLPQLNETLTKWQNITANQFDFELHKIDFPEPDPDFWLNLFRKCSSQRLFFPKLLPDLDALIYVDTDTLFLGPIEELWDQFQLFNPIHMTSLAWDDTNPNIAWYPRFAKHPFYGKYGLNSGVMLMNLTRMRNFGWMEYIGPVAHTWKDRIPWGDQDIINIILSHRSGAVRLLECRNNYRPDQCAHGGACAGAEERGLLVLHGSRGSFGGSGQPAFRACYEAIAEHQLRAEHPARFLARLDEYISRGPPSPCGALKETFLKVPAETLRALHPDSFKTTHISTRFN